LIYGDTALISIRNYNVLTGELVSHDYPLPSDTQSLRIRYSMENKTILYPLKNDEFLYIKNNSEKIEQFLIDRNGHLLAEPMIDSFTYDDYFEPDSIFFPVKFLVHKVSVDSLLTLNYLLDRNEIWNSKYNPEFKKQTKLTLYDKNLNIKKSLKIDSLLPQRYDFLRINNADKNHIYLLGRYDSHIGLKDTLFYHIFNWNGEVERQFTSVNNGEYISFETTYLEKEKEFLTVGISEDWSKLKFFKTNHNEGLTLIKEFEFKNNGRIFTPTFIEQLDNGDILLKGYNRFENGDYNYLRWHTWMRIKAKDLGLMVTSIQESLKNKSIITLFPNPTKNLLTITSNRLNFNKVIIYDVMGRKVYKEKFIFGNEKSFSIDFFNKGLYMAKIYFNNIEIGVEKFIKE
jgi:hypothetical protein